MSIVTTKQADIERAALDFLAVREHSRFELEQKLAKKFDGVLAIEQVLDALANKGYQSDLRYACAFIRYRTEKGYGQRYIDIALTQKGISRAVALSAYDELAVDWQMVAERCYHKRYGSNPTADIKEKEKRTRFLLSRGFSFDQLKQLITP